MNQFRLLGKRRFAPFFAVQSLAAFNDNAFRNATVVLVGFQLGLTTGQIGFYSNLAPALFILPFFLFSASAGQLAEKYEKHTLIRWIKVFEIVAMGIAAWGFYARSPLLLFVVLFLMGLHSTVFGPIKYAILPQVLERGELVGGNALVETGTSIAILVGMIAGGAAIHQFGWSAASALVIGVAVLGLIASFAIPRVPAAAPNLKFNWNFIVESGRVLKLAAKQRAVFNAILGISWFWFFGGVVTAQLPNYTRLYLGGGASVEILVLALFSIGVGIGSLLCERLSGHKVEIGLVPLGAFGMTLFGILLYFARHTAPPYGGIDWLAFLGKAGNGWIALDLTLLGLFAGFFIVPLFALVQSRTPGGELSRVIAGNNIINAVFLVAAAIFAFGTLAAGLTIPQLFLVTALLNAAVTLWIFLLVPEFLMRFVDWLLISVLYRVRVDGLENISEEGPALLVCNHVSFMDALIIMGSVRRPVRFVMYYKIFKVPVLRFVFRAAKAIPIAGGKENPKLMAHAFDDIDAALADGELVCIFPEGGLTLDGEIAPFRPGVEKILARRPVPVIPVALRGLWRSMWSRRDSKLGRARLPRRFRAHVELSIGAPMDGASNAEAMEAAVRALRGSEA
ncbi:MAG: Lysophospholipid transporter LplT / 2-acylglycerophosphoethanolamine acyltransferase [Rhodanobacteraceae bacterium]|jgi:1-acyl-sn-glycerol-3-phosphate acyltransferase|nr:MAG: Lysophospholipid transporter LplT / 2-acylglycerophosphoethanolamine acyltransferase [Rhodanobacteraceae bacterium]